MAYRPPKFTEAAPRLHEIDFPKSFAIVLQPATPEGDDFYGLNMGTNGTAAAARRAVAQAKINASCEVVEWARSNGAPAFGLQLVPGDSEAVNADAWSGEP